LKWQGSSQNNSIHKFVPKAEHMPRYSFVFIEHTERSSRALYDIIMTEHTVCSKLCQFHFMRGKHLLENWFEKLCK